MPRGVASGKQLAMMTKVLDDYCAAIGNADPQLRGFLATVVLEVFDQGVRSEAELFAALKARGMGGKLPEA